MRVTCAAPSQTMRISSLGRVGWAAAITVAGISCARSVETSKPLDRDKVQEMRIPFRVDPPLNHLDAAAIAGAITPHLNLGEHIAFVEHTPCPPQGCGDGIDVRAEALVLPEGSDLGWTIYLCKRKGRWLASRLGEEEGQAAGCPNPTRQTHTNGKGTPNLPSAHSLDSDETISATQAVTLAEDFFHAKAYGYRFDRSTGPG